MHGTVAVIESEGPARPEPDQRVQPVTTAAVGEPGLLRFMTCGSVDDGKSTLIGRLLYDSRLILEDQLAALAQDSRRYGTRGDELDFALLVDGLSAERDQGITIDVAYRYFATPRRSFIVADTPGHEQYTRNMATGASVSDLAVILVDARKGLRPQTKRHSFIAAMLGITDVVLAVNKMDLVGYSQARFDAIVAEYHKLVQDLGLRAITAIPMSATNGENVTRPSDAMPWYQGPHLLEHLETVRVGEADVAGDFRFPVQWVSRPNADFRGYAGTIASGAVAAGAAVRVWPSGARATVKSIVTAGGGLERGVAGQSVIITLDDDIDVSRGDIIASGRDAVGVTSHLTARLLWMAEAALQAGGTYLLKLGTRTVPVTVSTLHSAINLADYSSFPATTLGINDIGAVTIRLDEPIAFADYRSCRELGGFILIDRVTNDTVAMGLVDNSLATGAVRGALGPRPWEQVATRAAVWIRDARERPLRSIAKAITWRTTGSVDTFILSYIFTQSAQISAAISLTEIVTKLVLFYVHERLWARSRFGYRIEQKSGK